MKDGIAAAMAAAEMVEGGNGAEETHAAETKIVVGVTAMISRVREVGKDRDRKGKGEAGTTTTEAGTTTTEAGMTAKTTGEKTIEEEKEGAGKAVPLRESGISVGIPVRVQVGI